MPHSSDHPDNSSEDLTSKVPLYTPIPQSTSLTPLDAVPQIPIPPSEDISKLVLNTQLWMHLTSSVLEEIHKLLGSVVAHPPSIPCREPSSLSESTLIGLSGLSRSLSILLDVLIKEKWHYPPEHIISLQPTIPQQSYETLISFTRSKTTSPSSTPSSKEQSPQPQPPKWYRQEPPTLCS